MTIAQSTSAREHVNFVGWVEVRNPTKAWVVGFHLRSTQPTLRANCKVDMLPKRESKIGDRLTYHVRQESSPWNTYKVVPSEWAIAKITHYEPSDLEELPEFRGITIAYCVRQPLSPEEIDAMSYEIVSKVSVDSFGGDEEAYQKFLTSEESKGYVRG